ncbi:hypothetical protein HN51_017795 [Arachis hypogaea]
MALTPLKKIKTYRNIFIEISNLTAKKLLSVGVAIWCVDINQRLKSTLSNFKVSVMSVCLLGVTLLFFLHLLPSYQGLLFLSCSRSTIASTFPDFYFIPNGISLSNCPHHLFFAGFVSNLQLDIFIIMSVSERKIINLEQGWDLM